MLNKIKSLFCFHKWEIVDTIKLKYFDRDSDKLEKVLYRYVMRCTKCGNMTHKDF